MRIILWTTYGLIIGLCMASFMVIKGLHNALLASPLLVKGYDALHFPAQCLLIVWRSLGLPPGGDAGFILYPCSVVSQWFILGLLIGAFLHSRRKMSPERAPISGPVP